MVTNERGKGRLGCIVSILLFLIASYLGVKILPPYFNAKEFERQVANEGIKAVNRSYSDELVIKDVLLIAKGYNIELKPEDIKIRRFGERMDISIEFDLPIEFELMNYTYIWHFTVNTQNRSVL